MDIYAMIKDAISLAQKGDNLDLMRKLFDVQAELLDLQNRNLELERENMALREAEKIKEHIEYNPARTLIYQIDDGDKIGPYCTTCFEKEGKLYSMRLWDVGRWHCPVCDGIVPEEGMENDLNNLDSSFI